MNKSVSHYLRDYLKLTNSKFSLMGGADRALTPAEAVAAEATLLKYVKLKPTGPNDVFIYQIKSDADFAAAPVASSTGAAFPNYNAFVQDFKDVQRALVEQFLKEADAAEAAGAAGAPGAAKIKTPFMGGSRSKQYGGVTTEGLKSLKLAAAAAGTPAGVVDGVFPELVQLIALILSADKTIPDSLIDDLTLNKDKLKATLVDGPTGLTNTKFTKANQTRVGIIVGKLKLSQVAEPAGPRKTALGVVLGKMTILMKEIQKLP